MEELPITLHGCRAMVLGYGRLGRMVAQRLKALGARVTVAARKWSDLAWAEACGCCAEQISTLDGWLCGYDLLINTVPARVLTAARLADLRADTLVIDLASKPGGAEAGFTPRRGPHGGARTAGKDRSFRKIWAKLTGLCYNNCVLLLGGGTLNFPVSPKGGVGPRHGGPAAPAPTPSAILS